MGILPLVLAFLFGCLVSLLTWIYLTNALLHEAKLHGKYEGLKEAIDIASERADVALYMAPGGDLGQGLTRAQIAHTIESDLRTALTRVK